MNNSKRLDTYKNLCESFDVMMQVMTAKVENSQYIQAEDIVDYVEKITKRLSKTSVLNSKSEFEFDYELDSVIPIDQEQKNKIFSRLSDSFIRINKNNTDTFLSNKIDNLVKDINSYIK